MFEFTEDKKGLRPKYIGTIENNIIRKSFIILMVLPTVAVCIALNVFMFVCYMLLAFWKLVLFGTYRTFAGLFSKKAWESWNNPRPRKTANDGD